MRFAIGCAAALLAAACTRTPQDAAPAAAAAERPGAVEWVHVTAAADVEAAFAQARAANRPVFLYWGAVWCPPCNQVKSTVFRRADFVAQSRRFVPVYLDGDVPSAQKLGRRFRVSAYPTMILLRPDGTEVTRLAGAVDPAKYLQVLERGLAAGQTARQALQEALRGKALAPEDWRLLAYYSWETDEQQLVAESELAAALARLARACPPANRDAGARLALQAMVAAAAGTSKGEAAGALPRAEAYARARELIAIPEVARAHFDLVAGQAEDIVGYATAPRSAERKALVEAWNAALARLAADESLPRAGRLWALGAEVTLLRLDDKQAPLPATLLAQLRDEVARADRETTDRNERQSVIDSAAQALAQAGLLGESDALLKSELKRSHSPYYHMLGLAANARQRGDATAAIAWARQAYQAAQGQATRLQWGGRYVLYLIELDPADARQIEAAARQVLDELAATPDGFFARNRRVLERLDRRLARWGREFGHEAVLARLHERLGGACARITSGGPDRAACETLFAAPHA